MIVRINSRIYKLRIVSFGNTSNLNNFYQAKTYSCKAFHKMCPLHTWFPYLNHTNAIQWMIAPVYICMYTTSRSAHLLESKVHWCHFHMYVYMHVHTYICTYVGSQCVVTWLASHAFISRAPVQFANNATVEFPWINWRDHSISSKWNSSILINGHRVKRCVLLWNRL